MLEGGKGAQGGEVGHGGVGEEEGPESPGAVLGEGGKVLHRTAREVKLLQQWTGGGKGGEVGDTGSCEVEVDEEIKVADEVEGGDVNRGKMEDMDNGKMF